jgi:dihydropyrimidinase
MKKMIGADGFSISRREALGLLGAGWIGLGSRDWTIPGAEDQRVHAFVRSQPSPGLLIKGGQVVNATGVQMADVRLAGELIDEVGPNLTPEPGSRVIDATGKLVIPGGIDPHTHLHPGFVDDFTTGSRAALAGGITTVGTFVFAMNGASPPEAFDLMEARVRDEAIADVILHTGMWPPTSATMEMIPELVRRGQPSLKIFMLWRDFGAYLPQVIETLELAREAGVVTLIHCEDEAFLDVTARRMTAEGRISLRYYAESRPVVVEAVATQQAASLCEVTGAPMHVVHLSSRRALEACRNPATADLPLFVEIRPLYLYLTEERYQQPDGALYVGQPPLRTRDDQEALWEGLRAGAADIIATDHAPWTRAQKLDPNLSINRLRPGISSLQFMLPMFFSEGVRKRGIPLERFVDLTSTKAAQIMGLYPKKGVIRPGSEADIVVFDPEKTADIRAEDDHSRSDFSVYEGWSMTGWPVTTIRRGQVVFEEGTVTGRAGEGRLATREPWRA